MPKFFLKSVIPEKGALIINMIIEIKEKCFVCGHNTSFVIDKDACLFREALCNDCRASKRNSDVAHDIVLAVTGKNGAALSEAVEAFEELYIYEAQSTGKLHDILSTLPHYFCSEYYDDTPTGGVKNGVRCENLEKLTFPDNFFDLVITQDIFEHISNPFKGFDEIRRVLKKGGYHIFTIPLHEGRKTFKRAFLNEAKDIQIIKPLVYHGDPLRAEGSLVYTDFGEDIIAQLALLDMPTEIMFYSRWYSPDELTFIDDKEEIYNRYLESYKDRKLENFFKYNSAVLRSKKMEMNFTGERFIPGIGGPIAYEHLHRYALACEFAPGSVVLDIASGEGYGSGLLAKKAEKVIGVDISREAVEHACLKYKGQNNLEFRRGACTDIPCEDNMFDLVVSFETIEHVTEHEKMLAEVSRVLKASGTLLISTPNKEIYSDPNEFHLKELNFSEFSELLKRHFRYVEILCQRLTFSSLVWPLCENQEGFCHFVGNEMNISQTSQPPYKPLFFIAICTNEIEKPRRFERTSLFSNKADSLFIQYRSLPEQIAEKEGQIQGVLNSYSWKITAPLRDIFGYLKSKSRHAR